MNNTQNTQKKRISLYLDLTNTEHLNFYNQIKSIKNKTQFVIDTLKQNDLKDKINLINENILLIMNFVQIQKDFVPLEQEQNEKEHHTNDTAPTIPKLQEQEETNVVNKEDIINNISPDFLKKVNLF